MIIFLCFCFVFLCSFSEFGSFSGQPPGPGLVQTHHLLLQVTWRRQTSIPAGDTRMVSRFWSTFTAHVEHLCELTGDKQSTGVSPRNPFGRLQGFLCCAPHQSDWGSRLQPPCGPGPSDSETNPSGATGSSGLSAPHWKSSAQSVEKHRLSAWDCYCKLHFKGTVTHILLQTWDLFKHLSPVKKKKVLCKSFFFRWMNDFSWPYI